MKSIFQNLEFHITDHQITPLLGLRDALSSNLIQLRSKVHEVDTTDAFRAAILEEYKDLFQGDFCSLPVV